MNDTKQPASFALPQGEELKSSNFTGRVWLHRLVGHDDQYNCPSMTNVTFEPGCRNRWHKHPGGQILICVSGNGYYQEKGKPAQLLNPGDVVKIAPHVEHWHGATPDHWFAHIAIEVNPEAGAPEWLKHVTDAEYAGCADSSRVPLPATMDIKATDPEFAGLFQRFVAEDVERQGRLDPKTRLMVILASAIGSQAFSQYELVLGEALDAGITPVEVKEILYQAIPYAGMARARDFINATNGILARRGIELPLAPQATTSTENRFEKGLAVQKGIFGDEIDDMRRSAPDSQRHIQQFLSANCFGDYYTRNGIDVKTRELLTFSILVSMGGCEPQVKGHIRGNAHVGNDKQTMLDAVTQLLPYIGYPRTLNAISCLNEVLPD